MYRLIIGVIHFPLIIAIFVLIAISTQYGVFGLRYPGKSISFTAFVSPIASHERVRNVFSNGHRHSPIFFHLNNPSKDRNRLMARQPKEVILSDKCRNYLLEGIEEVCNIVRVTLGPRGRNVLLEKEYGPPMIVNDGVTIARNIEIKDRRRNAGAKLVQEVASTSDDRAGDGTTSTTILTAEIARKGVEYVNKGHNPIPLQKGIQKASKKLMEEVKRLAKPVEKYNDLLNIATVATSGNTVMGSVIAGAFDKLGKNAATILEDNPALEDALDFTEGYTFDRGYASPYFLVGEEKDIIEWQNPRILICDFKIESAQSILQILEYFAKNKKPLIIIADDFGIEAMQTLIINKMRGLLKVAPIKAPSFGERRKDYLRDMAIATNATLITKDVGIELEDLTLDMLGIANGVVIRKDRSSIITSSAFKQNVDERVNRLNAELDKCSSKFDREKLSERIAALSGGIARIMIGAATETEQKEKRLRYEDAINAVRAAIETGYVPGGGVTYLAMVNEKFYKEVLDHVEVTTRDEMAGVVNDSGEKYSENIGAEEMESEVELQKAGAIIVLEAMKSITKQIADNAGVDGNKIVNTILKSPKPFGFGWNAKTSRFGDMIKMGVIDPAKVLISAIEHSTSVAGLVLTTEGMMVEQEDVKKVKNRTTPDAGSTMGMDEDGDEVDD